MNRTKLLLFFNWPDTRSQIPMCMHVLASISTTFSWRKSQMCSCLQRLGAWSVMCHRWPSENDMHPSEILQLISQCCLLGRFAKMLYLIAHDLGQSSCCACHMNIAYIHVKLKSRVSQLNQHIFSVFRFRVASISEQWAIFLWFCAWRWYLNTCLPSTSSQLHMLMFRATIWRFGMLMKLKVATKRSARQCFARLGLRNEGHPDTWSHGNLAVLTANGRARITWVCSHIGLRPYPVGIMHFASASVM